MFRPQSLSQILSQLVVILPPSPLPTPPATPHPLPSSSYPLSPSSLDGHNGLIADLFSNSAGRSGNSLGGVFSRESTNSDTSDRPHKLASASQSTSSASSSSTKPRGVKTKNSKGRQTSSASRAAFMVEEGPSSSGSAAIAPKGNINDSSPESADRSPIAYSDDIADLNDTLYLDPQRMEGTVRPSRRVSSGFSYGFSPVVPQSDALGHTSRTGSKYPDSPSNHGHLSSNDTAFARARRVPQYEQSHVQGSALSRALADPQTLKQPPRIAHSAVQSPSGRVRSSTSTTAIPASINGAPDEGDVIVSARWDHSLPGRRLLFLSYHPTGMQIWDCTDLGSISEVLNLPSESVRQLIAGDSLSAKPKEDTPDMVIEYAGILSHGLSGDQGPTLGLLVTPTENSQDHVDESIDSVLLNSEDELDSPDNFTFLLIYSLVEHRVIKIVRIPGLSIGGGRFEVGAGFVVVSTTLPPALHVLSSSTFDVLHIIPASEILPFSHKPSPPHGSSSSHSRRHSFLETTSNLVNGIYNNYNEHFNDKYHNLNNRNNVLSPTVEHRFSSGFDSPSSYDLTGDHHGGQASYLNHTRRTSTHGLSEASQAAELPFMTIPETPSLPAPIFAVSGRLLAYASLPEDSSSLSTNGVQPRTSSTLSDAAVSTASAFGSTLSAQLANLGGTGGASGALGALGGITQADVGHAALKVGGSVLSGMKTLGGLAYKSALAAATDSGPDASRLNRRGGHTTNASSGGGVSGLANRFFSRSAPAATSSPDNRDRRYSTSSIGSTGIDGYEAGRTTGFGQAHSSSDSNRRASVPPRTLPIIESGYHVTVLDFDSLAKTRSVQTPPLAPPVVMHFLASKSQPVSSMQFSASGTSLLITPRDGQTISVYEIRIDPVSRLNETHEPHRHTPHGETKGSDASRSSPTLSQSFASPLHVYNLRRGRTSAVIESVDWASDGRWLAIGTRKRTVHVFATNPYGGPSDVLSHTSGRVRNMIEMPTMPTDVHPLVRLRANKNPRPGDPKVGLAFAFLEPSLEEERRLPPNLLPPFSSPHLLPTHQHSYGSVSTVMSSSPSTRSESLSLSPHQKLSPNVRPRNFQDVLVFDPLDGILSLRRIFVDVKPKLGDGPSILGTNFGSVGSLGASRSLPATNAVGRLSGSASPGTSPVGTTGAFPTKAENGELTSRESTVASWHLRRGKDWPEKKEVLKTDPRRGLNTTTGQPSWLAQAEISTYSTHAIPRSIYLSHQFSFRALGEDYHALIRRFKLDITGAKIEVRKGVEVSAYPSGSSESFIDGGGFAIHYDRRRSSSSFDEPLASALIGGLDHTPSQPVLPMYPNGTPGTKPRSFKNTIPIRTMAGIGDGMSEGIGRFRREIHKVRSPQLPSSDSSLSASVPLEFDEEDEDFLSNEVERDRSHGDSQSLDEQGEHDISISEEPLLDQDRDQWPGWVGEDRKAVEEVETFDDISAVGFLDEEIHETETRKSTKGKKKKRNL
ncbi:hypothetical protein C8R42DRAFT_11268 [Lentinula raphanica]|nr:hypothetical protein C8R42DRAFT_11268 [Lentinula raphanica]